MVKVTTIRGFYDLLEDVDRVPGDVFEATEERVATLNKLLPGFVETSERTNLGALKVSELRELAAERGIKLPAKATKAEIVELLEG